MTKNKFLGVLFEWSLFFVNDSWRALDFLFWLKPYTYRQIESRKLETSDFHTNIYSSEDLQSVPKKIAVKLTFSSLSWCSVRSLHSQQMALFNVASIILCWQVTFYCHPPPALLSVCWGLHILALPLTTISDHIYIWPWRVLEGSSPLKMYAFYCNFLEFLLTIFVPKMRKLFFAHSLHIKKQRKSWQLTITYWTKIHKISFWH